MLSFVRCVAATLKDWFRLGSEPTGVTSQGLQSAHKSKYGDPFITDCSVDGVLVVALYYGTQVDRLVKELKRVRDPTLLQHSAPCIHNAPPPPPPAAAPLPPQHTHQ